MININQRIRELRISYNYKNYEFAKLLDISQVFLSYIENGSRKPSLALIEKICDVLGITLSDFFNTEDSEISPELNQLLNNAKKLTPEQLTKLNDFIDTLKKN